MRRVSRIQVHPCYCKSGTCGGGNFTQFQNDIAVVTIDAPFDFNEFVQPICLPEFLDDTHVGKKVNVSGFGVINTSGTRPKSLQFVEVPVLTNRNCSKRYGLFKRDNQ